MPKHRRGSVAKAKIARVDAIYFTDQLLDHDVYPPEVCKPDGGPANPKKSLPQQNSDRDSDDILVDTDAEANFDSTARSAITLAAPKTAAKDEPKTRNYRNVQVNGGRPAVARRVTADLNSDDEIIVRMKQEKKSDKQIAEHLEETGRVKYNYKTISSRWKRLRIALALAKDKKLDEGLDDWHEGEDELLLQAIDDADALVFRLKADIDTQKWDIVAKKVKDAKPSTQYSKNACRSRYKALENGTASIPPELDADPAQRNAKMAEAKAVRVAQLAAESREKAIAETHRRETSALRGRVYNRAIRDSTKSSSNSDPAASVPHPRPKSASVDYNCHDASDDEMSSEGVDSVDPDTDIEESITVATPWTLDYGDGPEPPKGNRKEVIRASKTVTSAFKHEPKGKRKQTVRLSKPATAASEHEPKWKGKYILQETTAVTASSEHKPYSDHVTYTLKPITALSFRAQIAADADNNPKYNADTGLEDPDRMNRDELRAELKDRGLVRFGVKAELIATVKAARAGAPYLNPSPVAANRVWTQSQLAKRSAGFFDAGKSTRNSKKPKISQIFSTADTDAPSEYHDEAPVVEPLPDGFSGNDPDFIGESFNVNNQFDRTMDMDTIFNQFNTTQAFSSETFVSNRELRSFANYDEAFVNQTALPLEPNSITSTVGSNDNSTAPTAQASVHLRSSLNDHAVDTGRRLHVTNMPAITTEKSVQTLFGVHRVTNLENLRAIGAFNVDFADVKTAAEVAMNFDGESFKRSRIQVQQVHSFHEHDQFGLGKNTPALDLPFVPSSVLDHEMHPLPPPPGVLDLPIGQGCSDNSVNDSDPMDRRLLLTNAPFSTTTRDLRNRFANSIDCIALEPGVFCLEFSSEEAALDTLITSNGSKINGQKLELAIASE